MKVSDYIVEFLKNQGVDTVFGYSGGAITHLMDSLNQSPGIRFIQTYHEQTAAIAAEGYTWRSQAMGVALATSGPGATNMITGIADAYFDSIPSLFITGQVNTYEYKHDKPIRQQGFQEMDIVSIVKPITKYATMIKHASEVRFELEKAWSIAREGRGGPVVLDIPMDIQRAQIEPGELASYPSPKDPAPSGLRFLNGFDADALIHILRTCERPILLLGGGVHLAKAAGRVGDLARSVGLPVVTSLLGKGAFPDDDPLSVGMIGSYGNRCANMALANADLVLAIGTRLDTRQTGTNLPSFVRSGRIVRLDIDEAEMTHHRLKNVDSIVGDINEFTEHLLATEWGKDRTNWHRYVAELKQKYGQDSEVKKNISNQHPYHAMDILNHYAAYDQLFTVDIGQNQMFAAQKVKISGTQSWKTSGGHAPMGFALPAAIGAAFAENGARPIYAITGDGGLHMSIQSLLVIAQHELPIKVILLNNQSLGMITQFQDLYFDKRKEGTTKESGYLVPDFKGFSEACRLPYHLIQGSDYADRQLLNGIFTAKGPALIEFDIGESTIVSPKLEVNMPIEEIGPQLPREELTQAMLIRLWSASEQA